MKHVYKMVGRFSQGKLIREEDGLATVEYVVLIVLVAILGVGAWELFGEAVSRKIG